MSIIKRGKYYNIEVFENEYHYTTHVNSINYLDDKNNWQPIELDIQRDLFPESDYGINKNYWRLDVTDSGMIKGIKKADNTGIIWKVIGFGYFDTEKKICHKFWDFKYDKPEINKNKLVWNNVYQGINVELIISSDRLQTNVVLDESVCDSLPPLQDFKLAEKTTEIVAIYEVDWNYCNSLTDKNDSNLNINNDSKDKEIYIKNSNGNISATLINLVAYSDKDFSNTKIITRNFASINNKNYIYEGISKQDFDDLKVGSIIFDDSVDYTGAGDGNVSAVDYNYSTIQSATSGSGFASLNNTIGQNYNSITGLYNIYRTFMYFNTSGLPDTCTISSATLKLCCESNNSATDFNVCLLQGTQGTTLEVQDYDAWDSLTEGATQWNTSNYNDENYIELPLNSTGIGWINKTGNTFFCLRSDEDINASAPTNSEYVKFRASNDSGKEPKLTVVYAISSESSSSTSVSQTKTSSSVSVSVTKSSESSESVSVTKSSESSESVSVTKSSESSESVSVTKSSESSSCISISQTKTSSSVSISQTKSSASSESISQTKTSSSISISQTKSSESCSSISISQTKSSLSSSSISISQTKTSSSTSISVTNSSTSSQSSVSSLSSESSSSTSQSVTKSSSSISISQTKSSESSISVSISQTKTSSSCISISATKSSQSSSSVSVSQTKSSESSSSVSVSQTKSSESSSSVSVTKSSASSISSSSESSSSVSISQTKSSESSSVSCSSCLSISVTKSSSSSSKSSSSCLSISSSSQSSSSFSSSWISSSCLSSFSTYELGNVVFKLTWSGKTINFAASEVSRVEIKTNKIIDMQRLQNRQPIVYELGTCWKSVAVTFEPDISKLTWQKLDFLRSITNIMTLTMYYSDGVTQSETLNVRIDPIVKTYFYGGHLNATTPLNVIFYEAAAS